MDTIDRSASNTPPNPEQKSEDDLIRESLDQFKRIASAESDNRQSAIEDLRFLSGDQWTPVDKIARGNDRPTLTINQLPQFTKEVVNDMRQRRPQIKISTGEDGDPDTTKVIDGLVREIQYKSAADGVYDSGMEGATRNGFGYWRILDRYVDAKSFDQELIIQRIRNPFTVYYGPHINPDGSDVNDVFVTSQMSRDEFKRAHKGKDEVSWESFSQGDQKDYAGWATVDDIRVAERFYRVRESKTLWMLDDGSTIYSDEEIPTGRTLKLKDGKQVSRETSVEEIHWCKMTFRQVLDKRVLDGKYIPVVPVWGDEIDLEGKVIRGGLIRHAKDTQRAYNYWVSTATELVALAPKAPWIGPAGFMKGNEAKWGQANRVAFPALEYDGAALVTKNGQLLPPPQRQPFAEMPQGVMQMVLICREDMRTTTGRYQRAELAPQGPEQSGSALLQERMKGELGSFNYIDNAARAIDFTGRILVDLIPYKYDRDNRKVLTRGEDGTTEYVTVNTPDGKRDLRKGSYGVVVSVGPGYATRRQEGTAVKLDLMKTLPPQLASLIADLVARGLDADDSERIANRLKAMLPAEIKALEDGDTDELLAELPPKAREIVLQARSEGAQAQAMIQKLTQALQEAAKQLDDKGAILATDRYKTDEQSDAKVAVAKIDAAVKLITDENAKQVANLTGQIAQVTTAFAQVTDFMQAMQKRDRQLAADQAAAEQKASTGPVPAQIDPAAAAGSASPRVGL